MHVCITKSVNDSVLGRSHVQTQLYRFGDLTTCGYLLPLTHILRRVCPPGAWLGQDSGMAVGISEHSVTEQKKDNSRCVGSALWQRSGSDDAPNMCKHTASFFTEVSCTCFQMNSWHALWVDIVGNLCWAPHPLSEWHIT